jgi:hypothetical protein
MRYGADATYKVFPDKVFDSIINFEQQCMFGVIALEHLERHFTGSYATVNDIV